MTFKEATNQLGAAPDHAALARALNVSIAAIRQARLDPGAKAYRTPPKDWQYAVVRLAEQAIMRNRQIIDEVLAGRASDD